MSQPDGVVSNTNVLDSRWFHLAVRRLANSLGYGADRSPFVGSGIDYVQSRLYQPGDPIRSIDWRITARTGKPHVKEYETPRRTPVWLLIDTSASMTIGLGAPTKYETALFMAGGIALAALERMSPVGILGVGERQIRMPPTQSQPQIMGVLDQLRRFRYQERTTLTDRLSKLGPQLPERSLILLFSDLHDDEVLAAIKRVSGRHETVIFQLRDPASCPLKGVGFLRAREAETGRAFVAGKHSGVPPRQRELRTAGVDSLLVDVDRPYIAALRDFLVSRGLLGRGAR